MGRWLISADMHRVWPRLEIALFFFKEKSSFPRNLQQHLFVTILQNIVNLTWSFDVDHLGCMQQLLKFKSFRVYTLFDILMFALFWKFKVWQFDSFKSFKVKNFQNFKIFKSLKFHKVWNSKGVQHLVQGSNVHFVKSLKFKSFRCAPPCFRFLNVKNF